MVRVRFKKYGASTALGEFGPGTIARVSEALAALLDLLADSVVGGADLRISALGLAETWRRLDLRSRGRDSASAMHLLEQAGQGRQ